MADPKRIPPEPPAPVVPGGRVRPSTRVDLAHYPAIVRRQAINARLLAGTCAFDRDHVERFELADLDIVLRVTAERFTGEHALLRRQAITALGRIPALSAAEQLAALATSPAEHEAVRAAALGVLASTAPAIAGGLVSALMRDRSPRVREIAKQVDAIRSCLAPAPQAESARRPRPRRARSRTPGADRRR